MILLIACCLTFAQIQSEYYGEHSIEVASVHVDSLDLEGDRLNIALNRIARANYKHQQYSRGYRIASMVDYEEFNLLKWDTISLIALLAKNTHRFKEADSLFKAGINGAKDFPSVMYELHLNYGELKRLQSDYEGREQQLLLALSYAEGWQRDKVIRVLARHYFNIMLDFKSSEQIMEEHTKYKDLTTEGKIGYKLLQAQYQQSLRNYKKAQRHYMKANELASKAGFVGFQRESADGIMRSMMLVNRDSKKDIEYYLFNIIVLLVVASLVYYNFSDMRFLNNRLND